MSERAREKVFDVRLLRRLLPYVRRTRGLLPLALLLMLVVDASGVLRPYLVKEAVDSHIGRGDAEGLLRTVLLLAVVTVAGFLFEVAFNYCLQSLGQRLIASLRLDVFRRALSLSSSYFDKTPVGNTLTNVTNDVDAVQEFISDGLVSVLGNLLKVVFLFAAMLLINARLALIAFVALPLFLLATALFRNSIRFGYRGVRQATADINVSLVETINGIREIKQFGTAARSRREFRKANDRYLTAYLRVVGAYAVFFPTIDAIANLGLLAILLFAHFALGVHVQVGEVFAFFAYINMFFWPLRDLAEKFNVFQAAMAAGERIFRLLDETPTVESPAHPRPLPRPLRGDVVFENVTFGYSPENPVLHEVSFSLGSGEKVAIVGPTGSGKTTLASLLSRLYDIQRGRITISGVDLREIDLTSLRRTVATVPQDTFLFTGTVAQNISLLDPAVSRDQVKEAARYVLADRFIEKLPAGYDENVLEEGKRLSVGQKQLLGFARAFVRRPAVVVLDEATANIDSETESLVEEGVKHLLAGRSALIIAHRLSTIRFVDRILVVHRGRLVEEGTHAELLARDGIYRRLYAMQSLISASR